MRELEEKILAEGQVFPGNILKVGSFLNHQIDVDFLMRMGQEIARLYEDSGVNKILTIEASGIAIAVAAASHMHVPMVFAKKSKSQNITGDVYVAEIYSFTHGNTNSVIVGRDVLGPGDRVLVVDDFLANGRALLGLREIIRQAGAEFVGAAIAIEKAFQGAGDQLRSEGVRVESLAVIESMTDSEIRFRSST